MSVKVADLTVEELRQLIKECYKEAIEEREREQELEDEQFRADMESGVFWERLEAFQEAEVQSIAKQSA